MIAVWLLMLICSGSPSDCGNKGESTYSGLSGCLSALKLEMEDHPRIVEGFCVEGYKR